MTEKEEGAQGLTLSSKSNLDSDPTQENILEESIQWRGHPKRLPRRENKVERVDRKPPLFPNNVVQQYELGTKLL